MLLFWGCTNWILFGGLSAGIAAGGCSATVTASVAAAGIAAAALTGIAAGAVGIFMSAIALTAMVGVLEHTLHFELKKLGAEQIQVQDGRILFRGDYHLLAMANLCLSTAERVLIQLGSLESSACPLTGNASSFPIHSSSGSFFMP